MMKTVYINPKTQNFSFAPQSMQMASPYADPQDGDNGGTGNTEKLC